MAAEVCFWRRMKILVCLAQGGSDIFSGGSDYTPCRRRLHGLEENSSESGLDRLALCKVGLEFVRTHVLLVRPGKIDFQLRSAKCFATRSQSINSAIRLNPFHQFSQYFHPIHSVNPFKESIQSIRLFNPFRRSNRSAPPILSVGPFPQSIHSVSPVN